MLTNSDGLLATESFQRLVVEPRLPEVLRFLGYPRGVFPPAPMKQAIEQVIVRAQPRLQPRGTYSLYAVESQTQRSLSFGGGTILGNVGEFLHGSSRVAVFVVTAGGGITELSAEAWGAGDTLAGWAFDAIGSWAAEAAAEALMQQINSHLAAGEGLTLRYSPGYCGMDLLEQRTVFALAQPGSIGVSLLPSMLMQPMKSVSGLVGLGPRDLVGVNLSPCERCPQIGCHMRR
jgi:hypothetical protein